MKTHESVLLLAAVLVGLSIRLYFFTGMIVGDDLTHAYFANYNFCPAAERPFTSSFAESIIVRRLGVNIPLGLSILVFGAHEWSLALVPLLFSLGGIVVAYALLRVLAGPAAGVLAAWLWACLPADVYTATVWLQDNIFATMFAVFLLCLTASMQQKSWRWLLAFGAGLALGYLEYVKEIAYMMFVPLAISAAYSSWKARRFDWRIVHVFLGFLTIQAAVAVYFLAEGESPLLFWSSTLARYWDIYAAHDPPYPYPQVFGVALRYFCQQWVFGLGVVLFPLLALAALADPRTRLRGLLGLIFVIEAFILLEALKWGNWTQRYTLQLSVPFIVFAVLGCRTLLRRLPEKWDRRLMPVISIALILATAGALRKEWQQHGRFRAEVIRQAFSYVSASAAEDDKVYIDSSFARRFHAKTKQAFDLLAGYKPFKGGICPIENAYDATSGWVVISHLEQQYTQKQAEPAYHGPAPHWLEVFRAENNRGKYFARVFRILPEPPPSYVKIISRPRSPAPLPDVARLKFQPLAFAGPTEARQSTRWNRAMQRVEVTPTDDGLHCDLTGDPDASETQYGGVSFAVPGMRALRFELELTNPADISNVFVYAYGAKKGQCVKWCWNLSRSQQEWGFNGPVILVPNEPSEYFRIEGELAPELIREVNVFLRIKPGAQAGFILRDVAVCGADTWETTGVANQPMQQPQD